MSRIDSKQSIMKIFFAMSEGNPGALMCLSKLVDINQNIDPQSALGPFTALYQLDSLGIYGSDIYVLYSDICGKQPEKMIAVLRAVQLGILNPETVKDASSRQDYSGRDLIDVDAIYLMVKERLEQFDL